MSINPGLPHSPAWKLFSWAGFAISITFTIIGLYHLPADAWVKGYLSMSVFCTILSSFILAKTVRDEYEAEKSQSWISTAKTEKC